MAQKDHQGVTAPASQPRSGDIAEDAFNLWAVLNSANARLLQMRDAEEIPEEQFAELDRVLRVAVRMASDIGGQAMDLPTMAVDTLQ